MKSIYFSFALLLSTAFNSSAAISLVGGDLLTGISNAAGTAGLTTGIIRFGIWTGGSAPTSGDSQAALASSFIQVASIAGSGFYVDPVFGPFPGFYNLDGVSYDENATYGGRPYDSSATTANVAGDIAGERIYVWALNTSDPLTATEQLMFSVDSLWGDKNDLDAFSAINPTVLTWSAGAAGLTAHIGSLTTGPDIGGGAPSHQLAAIPEPSRAILAGLGLCVAFFRRRRRA
jgi:hypothetical protein